MRASGRVAIDRFRLVAVARPQSLNDCYDQEQTVKNITGAFFCPARTDTATVVTRGQPRLEGAWSLSPHSMGDHHGIRCSRRSSRALEQGKDRWSEGALQAQRHLGAARAPTDGEPGARACAFQSGNRQQTKEAVEFATLEWVSWFNHHRLLEPIGYIPPAEAEANYYRLLASQTTEVAA